MKYREYLVRWIRGPLGVLLVAIIVLFGLIVYAPLANRNSKADVLQVNGRSFLLQIARTEQERELGLGKRASMPANQGMLFVFDQVQPECFWMKDMHFSLDIIWINANKQVMYIKDDVSPRTYPDSFCPTQSVKYVIELNAGIADNTDMKVGETLDF